MKTTQAVINKWPSILPMLGVSAHYLTGKHTACPICVDGGKDRFRFDDKEGRGTYFCNSCGAGDGFKLLNQIHGWDFKKAANEVDRVIGTAEKLRPKPKADPSRSKARLDAQSRCAVPIQKGDSVYQYLRTRGINHRVIQDLTPRLRLLKNQPYYKDGIERARFDAMLAVVEFGAQKVTHHLTYLDNGAKARVRVPRKRMTSVSPRKGGAVQLFQYDGVLGIAEGIETAMAAYQLSNVPTWAALDANALMAFEVPDSVKELHIFADNDAFFTGQKAAYELAHRTRQKGLTVKVHLPSKTNTDWNDVLLETKREEASSE